MDGLWLLAGHLIGDYILQNDWMATNKVNPFRLPKKTTDPGINTVAEQVTDLFETCDEMRRVLTGHLACTVHCFCYTLAVWLCSFWWMPWWGLVACFAIHWPIDRFRLARLWMVNCSGQKAFATGPLSPWSIIVVDNTFHILTVLLIALACGK